MKKSMAVILTVLILAALAGLGMWRYVSSGIPEQAADAGAPALDVAEHVASAPKVMEPVHTNAVVMRKPASAVARVTPVVPATNVPPVAPVVVATTGSTNAPAKKAKASPMAGMAAMLKNPAMKEMIKAQMKAKMDLAYAPLFKYLNLSDEDAAAFKSLLIDKQMAGMDVGLDIMDQDVSAEDKKAKIAEDAQTSKAFDEKIKAVLGDEKYAVYKEYEETQPEREAVNLFKQTLPASDALTDQQEHDIIRAMFEERKNSPSPSLKASTSDPENFDPSIFTSSDKMDKFLQDSAQVQSNSLVRVSSILTPDQLAQFKQSQEQQRMMREMGLKMAAQMFGGADASGGDSAK